MSIIKDPKSQVWPERWRPNGQTCAQVFFMASQTKMSFSVAYNIIVVAQFKGDKEMLNLSSV